MNSALRAVHFETFTRFLDSPHGEHELETMCFTAKTNQAHHLKHKLTYPQITSELMKNVSLKTNDPAVENPPETTTKLILEYISY